MSKPSAQDGAAIAEPPRVTQWTELIGHHRAMQWFKAAAKSHRLGGSLLLVGSPGIGKRTVARLLAQTMLCESRSPTELSPCGVCPSCIQVLAGTHPDLVRVAKPRDRTFIPIELLVGPPEARMQEGFCRDIRLRPVVGKHKVAILEDADFLNEEGANCLLKTLEEPPPAALILLIGTSEQKQLPTIRSRCQIVRLGPLSPADSTRLLREVHQVKAADEQIAAAVEDAGGDIHAAVRMLVGESATFFESLSKQFGEPIPDPSRLAGLISRHVDQAGKEASKRRAAMRDVFSAAIQYYRRRLRDEVFHSAAQGDTLARLDRSVRALREVERSANQSTLIECFAADIALATSGDRGDIG